MEGVVSFVKRGVALWMISFVLGESGLLTFYAGPAGLEPATNGFGDRYSTN
jgi:hypothetical protein